ncbi:horcolin-like isoform X2 [Phragmites australis]|uniref:horcolin-like isoform X2 n=1 Tax=Phragmites australis TaxID=29695 RepID=UPI002D796BFF|nr:horcolin-like isoform X2 [Phragmites australis]
MSSVVKLGTWGGDGGITHDITVAPQRLESITIRWGKVIDWIAFSYRDRDKQLHTAGPWGGTGGKSEEMITLDASEYVTDVAGSVGPIGDLTHVITSLKIVTNRATYGPFGRGDGTPFNIPVLNNGSIVGMFARAGDYLDAVGFYILPF